MHLDWIATVSAWDSLWYPLVSLDGCTRLYPSYDAACKTVGTLACTCRAFRNAVRASPGGVFWELKQPYLCTEPLGKALTALYMELSQRRMLRRICESIRSLALGEVCIAGGYAAWQLERSLQTAAGREARPVTFPDTCIRGTAVRGGMWLPSSVDVYVTLNDNHAALLDAIRMHHNAFLQATQSYLTGVIVSPHQCVVPPSTQQLHALSNFFGIPLAPPPTDTPVDAHPESVVRSRWTFRAASALDDTFPCTLNVIFVRFHDPVSRIEFPNSVLRHADYEHSAICATVTDQGTLEFYASAAAVRALIRRRVVFRPQACLLGHSFYDAMIRGCKYVQCGFSTVGSANASLLACEEDAWIRKCAVSHPDHR